MPQKIGGDTMLNLIVGSHALGKTRTLRKIIEDCSTTFATNIPKFRGHNPQEYCCRSLDEVSDVLQDDVCITPYGLSIEGRIDISEDTCKILTVLCKDAELICIDEPEARVSEHEVAVIASCIARVSRTRSVWVSTHSDIFTGVRTVYNKYYTVGGAGNLVEITGDEADEYLHTF